VIIKTNNCNCNNNNNIVVIFILIILITTIIYNYFDLIFQRPVAPCEWMDSEDLLFMLYTSGSTGMLSVSTFLLVLQFTEHMCFAGKPKGIAHSTGDMFPC
jgi:hypothetical protein